MRQDDETGGEREGGELTIKQKVNHGLLLMTWPA